MNVLWLILDVEDVKNLDLMIKLIFVQIVGIEFQGLVSHMSEISQLINVVKESACDIYKGLGAGYNETIYEEAMALEFRERKINYDVEKNTEIFYKGVKVGIHRLDFIVENKLVVNCLLVSSFVKKHIFPEI